MEGMTQPGPSKKEEKYSDLDGRERKRRDSREDEGEKIEGKKERREEVRTAGRESADALARLRRAGAGLRPGRR